VSIILVYIYSDKIPIVTKIDELLSYRISFSSIILTTIPDVYSQFFGGIGSEVNKNLHLPMDLSYTAIIFMFGFIPALILMLMYSQALKIIVSERNYSLIALFTTFLLYGMVENILISFILNPTFYYVFFAINRKLEITRN